MTNKQSKQTARQRRRAFGTRKARKHAHRSQWRAQNKKDSK